MLYIAGLPSFISLARNIAMVRYNNSSGLDHSQPAGNQHGIVCTP